MLIKGEKPDVKHDPPFTIEDAYRNAVKSSTQGHQFINVKVKNSCRPHFGDCFVYEGPVTVLKQVVATPGSLTHLDDMCLPQKEMAHQHKGKLHHHIGFRLRPSGKEWLVVLMSLAMITGLSLTIWAVYTQIATEITTDDGSLNQSLIYSRSSWGAKKSAGEIDTLSTPVPFVIIIEAKSVFCETLDQCTEMVRGFQDWHLKMLNLADISVNFLIGGDGRVYEGRGWNKVGHHTLGYNKISIGIMFIGDFSKTDPKPEQIAVTQKLIDLGVQTGKIAKNYKLLGQRQVKSTDSPGERLFQSMKTWPHFDASKHYP